MDASGRNSVSIAGWLMNQNGWYTHHDCTQILWMQTASETPAATFRPSFSLACWIWTHTQTQQNAAIFNVARLFHDLSQKIIEDDVALQETMPMARLRTEAADHTCLGDGPRFTPALLRNLILEWTHLLPAMCMEKTGQPDVYLCLNKKLTFTPAKFNHHDWCLEKAYYLHNIYFELHRAIVTYGWPVAILLGHEADLPVPADPKWLF